MKAVFFAISNTLATPVFSPPDNKLKRFDLYTDALECLEELSKANLPIGIISNSCNEAIDNILIHFENAGLTRFINPKLILFGNKDTFEIFQQAAQFVGSTTNECLFVAGSSWERKFAQDAGFLVSPHAKLALPVINGEPLSYIRFTVPDAQRDSNWRQAVTALNLVLQDVNGDESNNIYATAASSAISELCKLKFNPELLGNSNAPLTTDLYFIRANIGGSNNKYMSDPTELEKYFYEQGLGEFILCTASNGLYVNLPVFRSIEEFHFPQAQHGHFAKLSPHTTLSPITPEVTDLMTKLELALESPLTLSDDDLTVVNSIGADAIETYLARYIGESPIDAEGRHIRSRHGYHSGNELAVDTLIADLRSIGEDHLRVCFPRFKHQNRYLRNVIAELPGAESALPIIISAHLDSTGREVSPYDPRNSDAPGADDDGSGIAGLLAIAKAFILLRRTRQLKRTIRFVLFNAEEIGFDGSEDYANSQTQIAGVFQMDMIGYKRDPAERCYPAEVHAGAFIDPRPEVYLYSRLLAKLIANVSPRISPGLQPFQIYSGVVPPIANDPMVGSSDHTSFQTKGFAACCITEDAFFNNSRQFNPNYHTPADKAIDYSYAADIARTVAAAAIILADYL